MKDLLEDILDGFITGCFVVGEWLAGAVVNVALIAAGVAGGMAIADVLGVL